IAPELALLVAGVVLLLVVAFRPGAGRGLLAGLTLPGLVVAGALTAWNWDLERVAFEGAVSLDGITRYARAALLATGVLATLMVAQGDVAGGSGGPTGGPPGGRGGGATDRPRGGSGGAGRQPAGGVPAAAVRPARHGSAGRRLRPAGGVHRPG